MDQLAPRAVAVATGLGASRERAVAGHEGVVEAAAPGQMDVAPGDVQNLANDIGERLTSGTVRTGDRGLLRREVRHDPGL